MKLKEGDLEFHFTNAIDAIIFDQIKPKEDNFHGIATMHRVDFVVELEEAILFVEVKDPGHPRAQQEGLEKFYNELVDGTLGDTFKSKFIDTFLYRWAEEKLTKPIHYLNLVTLVDEAQTNNLTDEIIRKLPPLGKNTPRWKKQLFENCQVFNLEAWNENFPKWPVIRISSQAGAQ